jgi:ubiquinone/menaquinone biosynthesis C-methylase UbiE
MININKELLSLICCPECQSTFVKKGDALQCLWCKNRLQISNGIIVSKSNFPSDLAISSQKWDKLYKEEIQQKTYKEKYDYYMKNYFSDVYQQLNTVKNIRDIVYLEIGSGDFLLGQTLASKCKLVIGVDTSKSALLIAQHMLEEKNVKNYLLIQADINHMPIRGRSVDLIYGGGVIEHFKDTLTCLKELCRVLKVGGVSFNTVPFMNIGSLTYRQIWGNIPNIPVLKQLAEFVHIKLLGAKHMIFGYEMSFTKKSLIDFHGKAGFRKIYVDKFKIQSSFDFVPKFIRPFFIRLANNSSFFWPMIKVVGVK